MILHLPPDLPLVDLAAACSALGYQLASNPDGSLRLAPATGVVKTYRWRLQACPARSADDPDPAA